MYLRVLLEVTLAVRREARILFREVSERAGQLPNILRNAVDDVALTRLNCGTVVRLVQP